MKYLSLSSPLKIFNDALSRNSKGELLEAVKLWLAIFMGA